MSSGKFLGVGFASLVAACSLITPLDGLKGSGVAAVDGGVDADSGSADVGSDVTVDAGTKPMKCALNGIAHTILTDADLADRIGVHVGSSGYFRVVVTKTTGAVIVRDVKTDFSSSIDRTFTAPGPIVFRMVPVEGAFVLAYVGSSVITAVSFEDTSAVPVTLAIPTTAPLPGVIDLGITFAKNGANLFAAFVYKNGTSDYRLYAGDATGGQTLKFVRSLSFRPSWDQGSIVLDRANKKLAIFSPPEGAVGDTTIVDVGFDGTDLGSRTLVPPGNVHFVQITTGPMAASPNPILALSANIQDVNAPLGYRVASVDDAKLATLTASDFSPLVPLTLAALPVDRSLGQWQRFGADDHVVLSARTLTTGLGISLVWFDGTGRLRATLGGSTALVPTEAVKGAFATLTSPPTELVSELALAWVNESHELRMARVSCTPSN